MPEKQQQQGEEMLNIRYQVVAATAALLPPGQHIFPRNGNVILSNQGYLVRSGLVQIYPLEQNLNFFRFSFGRKVWKNLCQGFKHGLSLFAELLTV